MQREMRQEGERFFGRRHETRTLRARTRRENRRRRIIQSERHYTLLVRASTIALALNWLELLRLPK